jgi:hypothetical protein
VIETWKPVPDFPGYEVSDQGRVRSFKGYASEGYKAAGWELKSSPQRILNPIRTAAGYYRVNLCEDGKRYLVWIHRLVLLAFVGPCPLGMEACHNDGVQANNYLDNLRWDTRRSNLEDRHKHGTAPIGEINGNSKLTQEQVIQIRELYSKGYYQANIGKLFSVSHTQVSRIINRKTWAHIP